MAIQMPTPFHPPAIVVENTIVAVGASSTRGFICRSPVRVATQVIAHKSRNTPKPVLVLSARNTAASKPLTCTPTASSTVKLTV